MINEWVPSISASVDCLTFADWQVCGIQTLSYYLDEWLVKPGLTTLEKLTHYRHYCAWPGRIVLNASRLLSTREGSYRIRSAYDGTVIQLEVEALFALMQRLQPEQVLLPSGSGCYWSVYGQYLSTAIKPYFAFGEEKPEQGGYYWVYDEKEPFALLVEQLQTIEQPLYMLGHFDITQMQILAAHKKYCFGSAKPIQDGMLGVVYTKDGTLNLLDEMYVDQPIPLDGHCACPICCQQLTRAYLHYLLQSTPLLAQRFLVQHNVYFWVHSHLRASQISL